MTNIYVIDQSGSSICTIDGYWIIGSSDNDRGGITTMYDFEARKIALQLADKHDDTATAVVDRAAQYFKFLTALAEYAPSPREDTPRSTLGSNHGQQAAHFPVA